MKYGEHLPAVCVWGDRCELRAAFYQCPTAFDACIAWLAWPTEYFRCIGLVTQCDKSSTACPARLYSSQ